jgi:hypothetical protein
MSAPVNRASRIHATSVVNEMGLPRIAAASQAKGWNGGLSTTTVRWESNLTAVDPTTGEVRKSVHLRYPNYSGTLATAGGLIFLALLDGTIAAYAPGLLVRWIVHTTPQQEGGDLLALGPQIVHRRFARPREFTHCLMLPIRNPHSRSRGTC